MAIDTTSPRTRRAVLAGVLGGIGVLLAEALGRPLGVRGADGDVVHVGDDLTGTRTTSVTTSRGCGIRGISTSTPPASHHQKLDLERHPEKAQATYRTVPHRPTSAIPGILKPWRR